jgi:hypothetical protein
VATTKGVRLPSASKIDARLQSRLEAALHPATVTKIGLRLLECAGWTMMAHMAVPVPRRHLEFRTSTVMNRVLRPSCHAEQPSCRADRPSCHADLYMSTRTSHRLSLSRSPLTMLVTSLCRELPATSAIIALVLSSELLEPNTP